MPEITQTNRINITPEKFLDACSGVELREIDTLIQSPRFVAKMKGFDEGSLINDVETTGQVPGLSKINLAVSTADHGIMLKGLPPIYYCSVCHTHVVDAENGFDTCQKCLDNQNNESMYKNNWLKQ